GEPATRLEENPRGASQVHLFEWPELTPAAGCPGRKGRDRTGGEASLAQLPDGGRLLRQGLRWHAEAKARNPANSGGRRSIRAGQHPETGPSCLLLRRQSFGDPAGALRAVANPVVQAVRCLLPELDAGRQHPEAAPAGRPGKAGSIRMTPRDVPGLLFQGRPAGEDAALPGSGRAEPGGGGTAAPVLV